jgi:glyoxylase-like metal-dependent hydrolase (beta-lactamase superfamily II)
MNATDEWYEVSRLTENGYRITEANDYGMFLVEGDERAVLVDAGAGVGELHSVVTDLVDTPITLVLTHTHWDHIGAASQFDDVLVSPLELPPDGRIRVDSLSGEFVERPTQFTNRWVDAGKELPNDLDRSEQPIDPTDADPLPADGGCSN